MDDEIEETIEDRYRIPKFIAFSIIKIVLILFEWILFLVYRILLILSGIFNHAWSWLDRCSIHLDEISEDSTRRILYLPKPKVYFKPEPSAEIHEVSAEQIRIEEAPPLKFTGRMLNDLTKSQFVRLITRLLVKMGFKSIRRVERARDRGADIIAFREDPFGRLQKYAILCKKYAWYNNVRGRQVQVFCSMVREVHEADQGVFITTSNFSSDAKEIAERFPVELIGRQRIVELLNQYGVRFSKESLI